MSHLLRHLETRSACRIHPTVRGNGHRIAGGSHLPAILELARERLISVARKLNPYSPIYYLQLLPAMAGDGCGPPEQGTDAANDEVL